MIELLVLLILYFSIEFMAYKYVQRQKLNIYKFLKQRRKTLTTLNITFIISGRKLTPLMTIYTLRKMGFRG